MKGMQVKVVIALIAGFAGGLLAADVISSRKHATAKLAHVPAATSPAADLETMPFDVAIFEIKQKLTPGNLLAQQFSGRYTQKITLSTGEQREIELVPTVHNGKRVVKLMDSGNTTYMSLNGTTLNGTLLVQLKDKKTSDASLKAEGWPVQ